MDPNDIRVAAPIFTPKQVSTLAEMPLSTVYAWMKPTFSRPALIHSVTPERRGWPSIPLVGAAEAMVLRPLRETMSMREMAAAVEYLREHAGQYALGSPELLHDGYQALIRSEDGEIRMLMGGHPVLPGLLEEQLKPFRIAPDGFVEALTLNTIPETDIDPRFTSGRLRFTRTGVPVFAVRGLLDAGERAEVVADEYGVDLHLVRAVERADPDWLAKIA